MSTTTTILKFWVLVQMLITPLIAFSGIDQPWNDPNDGGGDPAFLGYLLVAGLAAPVLSKVFDAGPWKGDSWFDVGITGVCIALALVLAIQVAIVAIFIIPIYLLLKFFGK